MRNAEAQERIKLLMRRGRFGKPKKAKKLSRLDRKCRELGVGRSDARGRERARLELLREQASRSGG